MPITVSTGMRTMLDGEHTTLAMCLKITRTDNVQFFFTEHDQPLNVDGDIYTPIGSFNKSAISSKDDLSVDNLEIIGSIDDASITDEDMWNGLFDFARVELFFVDWTNTSNGKVAQRYGKIGEVRPTEAGFFFGELRGLTQQLATRIVERAVPECRADLGDNRCKVPIDPPVWSSGVDFVDERFPAELGDATVYEFRIPGSGLVSDYVTPTVRDDRVFRVTVAGRSNPVEPTWDVGIGNATTQPWAGFTAWSAAEVVTAGTVRRATTTPTDKLFVCTTGGTTGGAEPTWNTTVDGTTNDNGVVWTTYPLPPEWETLDAYNKEGAVDNNFPFSLDRRTFHVSDGFIVAADGYYAFGVLTWTSGANTGRRHEVREWLNQSASYVQDAGSPNLDFDQIGGNDRLVRDAGSFIDDGFTVGMRMTVSGSPAQDGDYLVTAVTALTLTINGDWPAENLNTTGVTITGSLRQITLFEQTAFDIANSDTFLIYPGCQKRVIDDCQLTFNNVINFRGEDRIPGNDSRFAYPDPTG